jgi:hypothetical protein
MLVKLICRTVATAAGTAAVWEFSGAAERSIVSGLGQDRRKEGEEGCCIDGAT